MPVKRRINKYRLPKINIRKISGRTPGRTSLQFYVQIDGVEIKIHAFTTDDKFLPDIEAAIKEGNDRTELIEGLYGLINLFSQGSLYEMIARKYATNKGIPARHRYKFVPDYINTAALLNEYKTRIKKLQKEVDHGIDRG